MKVYFQVFISLILSTSLLQAAAFEKKVVSKTTAVFISAQRPLSKGSNVLVFAISKDEKVLEGSQVRVKAFMPAMPGMPAMEYESDARYLGEGRYEAVINLAMGGTWQLHIFITPAEGKKLRVKTSLDF